MENDNSAFIKCVMDAFDEGERVEDIEEECACRTGYSTSQPSGDETSTINH